jgi:predicted CXXCH cytochrome family protein
MNSKILKTVIVVLVAAVLLTTGKLAIAGPISDVVNSKHNLSVGGSSVGAAQAGSGVTQVCIFCHTPHNAGRNRLLWNKASNAAVNFRLYTSSGSLTSVTKGSQLTSDSPSLLCLSCHDGKTAMNILHNSSNGVDAASVVAGYPAGARLIPVSNGGTIAYPMPAPLPDLVNGGDLPDMRLGGTSGSDLTNDHPIGFSYTDARAERATGLHDAAGMDSSIRFFGPKSKVECSTCHNPHISGSNIAYKPFLVKSNAQSALCLTCHDK